MSGLKGEPQDIKIKKMRRQENSKCFLPRNMKISQMKCASMKMMNLEIDRTQTSKQKIQWSLQKQTIFMQNPLICLSKLFEEFNYYRMDKFSEIRGHPYLTSHASPPQKDLKDLLSLQNSSSRRKLFERKTNPILANKSRDDKRLVEKNLSPKYLPNRDITSQINPEQTNSPKKLNINDIVSRKLPISRLQGREKSGNSRKVQKGSIEKDEYYKYWKKKATQYQQMNFNLERLKSSLQQQNEILKRRLQKVEKKSENHFLPLETEKNNEGPLFNASVAKVEKYYREKIDHLRKCLQEKDLLIAKQDKKIKGLSKQLQQNYKMKNLLDNMEGRISEMGSLRDRNSSYDKLSEKSPTRMTLEERRIHIKNYLNVGKAKSREPHERISFSSRKDRRELSMTERF